MKIHDVGGGSCDAFEASDACFECFQKCANLSNIPAVGEVANSQRIPNELQ